MSGKVTDNLGRSSGLVKAVAAGREGTVDWDTSNNKTSNFTAEDAKGYLEQYGTLPILNDRILGEVDFMSQILGGAGAPE